MDVLLALLLFIYVKLELHAQIGPRLWKCLNGFLRAVRDCDCRSLWGAFLQGFWDTSSHPGLLLREISGLCSLTSANVLSNTRRLREKELSLPAGQLREIVRLPEGLFDHSLKWVTIHLLLAPLDIASIWKIAHSLQKSSISICSSSGEAWM